MKTKFIFLLLSLFVFLKLEARDISGTIYSADDKTPVAGAIIRISETTIATMSDYDGKFTIKNIPITAKYIEISFTGLVAKTIELTDANYYDVYLERADIVISDVVVTGYNTKKDEIKLGYSVTEIDNKKNRNKNKDKSSDVISLDDISSDYSDFAIEDVSVSGTPDDAYDKQQIHSGMLTAGELNDFGKWEMWDDISQNDLKAFRSVWKIIPYDRYCVMVTSPENKPIIDAVVYLKSNGNTIWTARTDNTGKAELWDGLFDSTSNKNISIQVDYKGVLNSIDKPTKFHDGINRITISSDCNTPNNVEIAFVVDATGSMGDEMYYLQSEILDVLTRVKSLYSNLNVNLGSVFYRDKGDSYITKFNNLTSDLNSSTEFFKQQTAGGGGDFPEAVDSALYVAINNLSWSQEARTRIIFLVLDAPPHSESNVLKNIQELTKQAAAKGIRIVPVTCSGIDKSTEYLMRSIALATNGTYVFLTDDSGIGGSHIKPSTDKWEVEFLNDLLVRVIKQYIFTPDCQNKIEVQQNEIGNDTVVIDLTDVQPDSLDVISNDTTNVANADTTNSNNQMPDQITVQTLKIYPNPTSGLVNIEISSFINEFYLCDFSGKILQRVNINNENIIQLDLSNYPQGFYFIRYYEGETLYSGKIVLIY